MKVLVLIVSCIFTAGSCSKDSLCNIERCDVVRVKCDSKLYDPCDGQLLPRGGPNCTCCPVCLKFKDDYCGRWEPCRPPLICKNEKCVHKDS